MPFKGKSLLSLAKAHTTEPLPALPEHLPAALHQVLSKAAAKLSANRYATAGALRAASGSGAEPLSLPQLDYVFILQGAGRHGARLVALPGVFERQSDEVWPWVSQRLFDVGHLEASRERVERAPYKGRLTQLEERFARASLGQESRARQIRRALARSSSRG